MDSLIDRSLGELVQENWKWAEVFRKYGLDFCCGGKKSLKESLEEAGLSLEQLQRDLDQRGSGGLAPRFSRWSIGLLCDYIRENHHSYVEESIETLNPLVAKISSVHGDRHPELGELEALWKDLTQEILDHLKKEEEVLFPLLEGAEDKGSDLPSLLEELEREHQGAGDLLAKMADLSGGYQPPEDSCNTWRFVYHKLQEFEQDLHIHIHLENNVLFPKVRKEL